MRHLMIPVCAWLAAAACVPDGPAIEQVAQAAGTCTQLECSGNSPVIDGLGFHELYTDGHENLAGFAVMDLRKGLLSYALAVRNGEIRGHRPGSILAGAQLVGAAIRLKLNGTKEYLVRIKAVHQVQTATSDPWAAYEFEVELPSKETVDLCAKIPEKDVEIPRKLSVVFERDQLDAATKTVTQGPASLFTIGCAGSAPAKMVVNVHTHAAKALGYSSTTLEQRQAFLKMITGDYCGTGTPFTVAGQPLEWKDATQYVDYQSPLPDLKVEARWSSTGAECLNVPRINANPTDAGEDMFGLDVLDDIKAECEPLLLKECGDDLKEFAGAHLISANPG